MHYCLFFKRKRYGSFRLPYRFTTTFHFQRTPYHKIRMPQWKWEQGEELIIFKVVIRKAIEFLLVDCVLLQSTVQRYALSSTWQNYFLPYDCFVVSLHAEMTQHEIDIMYMRRCLQLAAGGLGRVRPNPLVGCVVVSEVESGKWKVESEGYHQCYGEWHAERNALLRNNPLPTSHFPLSAFRFPLSPFHFPLSTLRFPLSSLRSPLSAFPFPLPSFAV